MEQMHAHDRPDLKVAIFKFVFGVLFLASSSLAAFEVPDSAKGADAFEKGDPRVEAQLVMSRNAEVGQELEIGVVFEIDPDWHIYWRNSGESGLDTKVDFGDFAGPNQWQAPHVFLDPSKTIATFGYSEQTLIWATAKRPAEDEQLNVVVNFLVCKVDCIPGRFELSRAWESEVSASESGLFEKYHQTQTETAEALGLDVELKLFPETLYPGQKSDATLTIGCTDCELALAPGVDDFLFIPDANQDVEWRTVKSHTADTLVTLQLQGLASPDGFGPKCWVRGVVHLLKNGDPHALDVVAGVLCGDSRVDEDPLIGLAVPQELPEAPEENLLWVLLLAFLGGLILNLMPCVFPVLAIKVAAFVELASHDQRTIIKHDLAFVGGTVGAMGTLGALAIGLRTAGVAVGWGFQFQEPWFLLGLAVLIVLFSLNLFGVFEVTFAISLKPGGERTLMTSVGEGVLAVVLATPCSAPLLGTAVGFALTADALVVMLVFLTIGLGLAAPFVVLTLIPAARGLLPRPGNWMIYFKQLMGFMLLATAIWVIWILAQSVSNNSLGLSLSYLLVASIGAWIFGASQFGKWRWMGRVALILTLLSGPVFLNMEPGAAAVQQTGVWSPWSPEAVKEAVVSGNPVFVDFTADWCITCKVNENGVLASDEVLDAFGAAGVVLLKGDWTRRDERIHAELARYGKAGVPLYLMVSPAGKVQVLPELLTPEMVLDALKLAIEDQ